MGTKSQNRERKALWQIGDIADRVGLSLRTVRYYEEVGLLEVARRTDGGFRLFGEDQLDRLLLIKQMKPLGLSIDEMRKLLEAREILRGKGGARAKNAARAELERYAQRANERCGDLRSQLESSERFAHQLREEAAAG